MRAWRLTIDELSRERVAELRWFCLQYPEKKARLAALRRGFNAFAADGQPKGRGRHGDPTAARAIKAAASRDRADVAMIEAAARQAARGSDALVGALIRNVCEGIGVRCLAIPMGPRQYYAMRRQFYRILDGMQRDTKK